MFDDTSFFCQVIKQGVVACKASKISKITITYLYQEVKLFYMYNIAVKFSVRSSQLEASTH